MRRMAVEHEEHWTREIAHEGFELADKQLGIKFAGINVIPKSTRGIDRRNGVDLLTLTAGRDDRRLAFGTPGPLQGRVRAHTGLVDEEDVGAKPLGARLQLWIVLPLPLGDRHGVALI